MAVQDECRMVDPSPEAKGDGWVSRCACGWCSSVHQDRRLPFLAFENHSSRDPSAPELRGLEEFLVLMELAAKPEPTRVDETEQAFRTYWTAIDPPGK